MIVYHSESLYLECNRIANYFSESEVEPANLPIWVAGEEILRILLTHHCKWKPLLGTALYSEIWKRFQEFLPSISYSSFSQIMRAFLFFSPQLLIQLTIDLLVGNLLIELSELLYFVSRDLLVFLRLLQQFVVLCKNLVNLRFENLILQLVDVFALDDLFLQHIYKCQANEENRVPAP